MLSSDTVLLHASGSGKPCFMTTRAAAVIGLCQKFATLEEHAHNLRTRFGWDDSRGRCDDLLRDAVKHGILITEDELRMRLVNCFSRSTPQPPIGIIAIPTRERPQMLRRLLSEIVPVVLRADHEITLAIVDASTSSGMEAEYLKVICEYRDKVRISYWTKASRERVAYESASATGIVPDVAFFGLCGSSKWPVSTGASRNLILALCAGRTVLFVDDDIRWRCTGPDQVSDGVTFRAGARNVRFFRDREDFESLRFETMDLLEVHENAFRVAHALGNNHESTTETLNSISQEFLNYLERDTPEVRVSMLGLAGDAGIDDPIQYYIHGPEGFATLVADADLYHGSLSNRLLLCAPTCVTLTRDWPCMAGCMAVNNNSLLPPFSPVQRAQEMVFDALVKKCVSSELSVVSPQAVLHDPYPPRQFEKGAAPVRGGKFLMNETIAAVIKGETIHGDRTSERLASIGSSLLELSGQSDHALRVYLSGVLETYLVGLISQVERVIESVSANRELWLQDALAIRASLIHSLANGDHSVPWDCEQIWNEETGRREFRTALEMMGHFLTVWPKLAEAVAMRNDVCAI